MICFTPFYFERKKLFLRGTRSESGYPVRNQMNRNRSRIRSLHKLRQRMQLMVALQSVLPGHDRDWTADYDTELQTLRWPAAFGSMVGSSAASVSEATGLRERRAVVASPLGFLVDLKKPMDTNAALFRTFIDTYWVNRDRIFVAPLSIEDGEDYLHQTALFGFPSSEAKRAPVLVQYDPMGSIGIVPHELYALMGIDPPASRGVQAALRVDACYWLTFYVIGEVFRRGRTEAGVRALIKETTRTDSFLQQHAVRAWRFCLRACAGGLESLIACELASSTHLMPPRFR